ncbi:MAG: antibiotic biosynthesis monooxygenase [Roseibium sp.]|nr:antibiotic biosynthesis monooxygenase [Roseibium sp.]
MIKRVWHGWTTPENADAYFRILTNEVIPGIETKKMEGFRSIEVLRRELKTGTEFCTVMTFETLDNIIALHGEDYERSYVPDAAQKVLSRWDQTAQHFEILEVRRYDA